MTGLPPGDFEATIPAVDGFTYTPNPDVPVPWTQLDLPSGAEGLRVGVRQDGLPIGSLLLVDGISHSQYVGRLFDEPVRIVRDPAGAAVDAGETRAVWRSVGGHPVVAAILPDAALGQWVWAYDGLTWIAAGAPAMEQWLDGFIAVQLQAEPDETWDYGTLAGSLYTQLPVVPGFTYIDQPVANALDSMMSTLVGDCAKRFYLGHIAPIDDPAPLTMEPADLRLAVADVGGTCLDDGFMDQLDAALEEMGLQDDVIGDVAVRRGPKDIVVVDGDRLVHLDSEDPATLVTMAPFINAFVTGDLPPDVTNDTTLAAGTCLFRAPSETGRDEDRRAYATDCAAPHQGEVFLHFDIAPGSYQGDAATAALAEESCNDGFADYIGIPASRSRLNILYFYPTLDGWAAGNRAVTCIVYGSTPEEYFRTSLAGVAQ